MGSIHVSVCARTDRGRSRTDNQDCFLVLDLHDPSSAIAPEGGEGGFPPEGALDFTLSEQGAILLVADGMGGRAGGARASGMAISAVKDVMLENGDATGAPTHPDFAQRLERALEVANTAIHEGGRVGPHAGMGSTATLAGLLGEHVYIAQIGDSRAYLVRSLQVGRLTRDQSLLQDLIDSGVLDEGDTRAVGSNMILQALGPTPTVEPAVTYHELRRGDVLLLCSDGLSGVVRDEEIRDAVAEASDCVAVCEALVDLANERGGPDNITVVAARIGGTGLGEALDTEVVRRKSYPRSD